jgi:hypothetical protein
VKAGLIRHRIPCFGYVVQETDKAGALLEDKCKALNVTDFKYYPELKVS